MIFVINIVIIRIDGLVIAGLYYATFQVMMTMIFAEKQIGFIVAPTLFNSLNDEN